MATRSSIDALKLRFIVDSAAARKQTDAFIRQVQQGNIKIEQSTRKAAAATKHKEAADRSGSTTGTRLAGSLEKVNKSMEKYRISIAQIRNLTLLFNFAMGFLGVRAIGRFLDKGRELVEVRVAFEGLTNAANISTDVIDRLREVTRGTVSELDLMKQVNNALLLGIRLNADGFEDLVAASVKLGKAVGLDATSAITSMITGIGRQSRLMLDNLGIVVSLEAAYRSYAVSVGRSVDRLSDLEKKIAFQKAVALWGSM